MMVRVNNPRSESAGRLRGLSAYLDRRGSVPIINVTVGGALEQRLRRTSAWRDGKASMR
ncbi:MAG: hypothetical protein JWN43_4306 [Gammaproteobacteria bacterium]|nr:hypothetical protein [Gammaproteobacteria bacterium]